MLIDQFELAPYALPLTDTLQLADVSVTQRLGILVQLSCEGVCGQGDVAPLPGFSHETRDQAQRALEALQGVNLDLDSAAILSGETDDALRDAPPSVRFGIECAVLELEAKRVPHSENIFCKPDITVPVNALLVNPTPAGVAARVREGYTCLKVKVGRRSLSQDIEVVSALAESLGDAATLRLDANRAWSMADARVFAEAVQALPVAYLEEPCGSYEDSLRLAQEAIVPIALDESLNAMDAHQCRALTGLAAFVIKPTLSGGVSGTIRLARAARACGAEPVISAAFESGVGIRALAYLANFVMSPGVAAGLDTWRWLAEDVLDHDGSRCEAELRFGSVAT